MYGKYINKYIFDLTSIFKNRINYISILTLTAFLCFSTVLRPKCFLKIALYVSI